MANDIQSPHPPGDFLPEEDYEAIESAVMETARGRWFLAEYARRNRAADTHMLLKAIHKLEKNLAGQQQKETPQELQNLLQSLEEISSALRLNGWGNDENKTIPITNALEALASQTKQINHEILDAAEAIEEAVWLLRQQGLEASICDKLDASAREIYTTCSLHTLNHQPLSKMAAIVRFIEGRIQKIMAELSGPGPRQEAAQES